MPIAAAATEAATAGGGDPSQVVLTAGHVLGTLQQGATASASTATATATVTAATAATTAAAAAPTSTTLRPVAGSSAVDTADDDSGDHDDDGDGDNQPDDDDVDDYDGSANPSQRKLQKLVRMLTVVRPTTGKSRRRNGETAGGVGGDVVVVGGGGAARVPEASVWTKDRTAASLAGSADISVASVASRGGLQCLIDRCVGDPIAEHYYQVCVLSVCT